MLREKIKILENCQLANNIVLGFPQSQQKKRKEIKIVRIKKDILLLLNPIQ